MASSCEMREQITGVPTKMQPKNSSLNGYKRRYLDKGKNGRVAILEGTLSLGATQGRCARENRSPLPQREVLFKQERSFGGMRKEGKKSVEVVFLAYKKGRRRGEEPCGEVGQT